MDAKTDTQQTHKTEDPRDVEALNHQLMAKPSAELHLQRVQSLQTDLTEVVLIRESLDWLSEHDKPTFDKACVDLQEVITVQLGTLPELNKTSDDESGDKASMLVQRFEPLADYFPIIHLSHGLLLMHQTPKRRHSGTRSPLDILEEILAESDGKQSLHEQDTTARLQKARTHLQRAAQLLGQYDSKRGIALEALGRVCEDLKDPIGAWQAYQQAESYDRDFADKLAKLSQTINTMVRQRLLEHIDVLLKAGNLTDAAGLLERCMPAEDNADFRIRAADLTFLKGDFDSAIALYKDLMEKPQ